jgi:formate dehydrogenase
VLLKMGRKVKWKDVLAHPHGFHYGEKRYGQLSGALRTPDKKINVAPERLVADLRGRLEKLERTVDPEFPLAIVSRRRTESMNSWINELPGIHRRLPTNTIEINATDARSLGISTGDVVALVSPVGRIEAGAVVSDAPRPGVVVCAHGWGSRVFDPTGAAEPYAYGANRNLLVDHEVLDALSQVPALNGQAVRLERVGPAADAEVDARVPAVAAET